METTAVMEPETSDVEDVAPSGETATDPTPQETAEPTPETGEPETFTADDIAKAVQAREAEIRTQQAAELEQAKAAAAQQQFQQHLNQARTVLANQGADQLAKTFEWMATQIDEGKPIRWNRQVFDNLARQMSDAAFTTQQALRMEHYQGWRKQEFGDLPAPPDLEHEYRTAVARGDGDAILRAEYKLTAALERAKLEPKLRKEIEDAEKAKAQAAQKTDQIKKQDAAAKGPAPTRGLAPGAGKAWTQTALDALPDSVKASMARAGTLQAAIDEARGR